MWVVPDTSSKSVAPVVEVVVHAHLWRCIHRQHWPCARSSVVPSSVGRSRDQVPLPAGVYGSPDHDVDLGGDDMAPLEHQLASGPSLSPHPSLDVSQATLGKHSVKDVTLLQVHPPPKCVHQAPCTVGPPVLLSSWYPRGLLLAMHTRWVTSAGRPQMRTST